MLLTGFEHHLHAHADPQNGAAPGEAALDEAGRVDGAQHLHDGAEGPHAGDEEPVGGFDGAGVGGEIDLRSDSLQGSHGGAHIAGAVVEDDDAG